MSRIMRVGRQWHGSTTVKFVLCRINSSNYQASVFIDEHSLATDSVVEVCDVSDEDAALTIHTEQMTVWKKLLRLTPGTTGVAHTAAVLRSFSKENGAELPKDGIISVADHKTRMRRLQHMLS